MRHKSNILHVEGVVVESSRNALFTVEVYSDRDVKKSSGEFIMARPCGRLTLKSIKIVNGDRVRVEVPLADLDRGRIVRRID